jgi:hypothetical protein
MIVNIEARIGQLEAEMKKATAAVDKFGSQAKANTANSNALTAGFKKMAGAITGLFAIQQVTRLMTESAKAAVEDNKSFALMERQMKATAGATHEQAVAVNEQIGKLAIMSGVVDDNIRPAYSKLLLATKNTGEAMKLTSLAMDIAAATGKSATGAAMALARAHDGNFGALQRLVPGIKDVSDKMGYLEKQFAGAAKVAGDADPYARMNVALDTIKESIGRALLPMLNKFVDWLTKAAPKIEAFFKSLNDPTTEIGKKWKTFTDTLKGAFDWFTKNYQMVLVLTGAFIAMKIALGLVALATELAAAKQWLLNVAMDANPAGLLAIAIMGVATALGIYATQADHAATTSSRLQDKMISAGQAAVAGDPELSAAINSGLAKAGYGSTDETKRFTQRYGSTSIIPGASGSGIGGAGGAGAKKTDPFVDYLKNTQKQILAARDTYDKAVKAANDKYGALIQQYSDEMASIIQRSMDRLKNVFATATATDVGSIFKNLQEQGNATADQLLKQLQDKLNAGRKLAENAASLAGLGYSQTFIEQVVAQGTDTGNALAEALKIATPDQAKAIQDTFRQSEVLSNSGMDGLAKSLYEKSGLATDELKGLFDTAQANMVKAQTDLQNALAAAAQSLNDSLTTIEASFTAKLASMGSKAKAYRDSIRATFGLLANNFVDTSGGAGSVININTTANTNASPETIAQATLNAAKFGMPAVI